MTQPTEHLGMAPARPSLEAIVQEQAAEIARLRELCGRAYDAMTREDWDHMREDYAVVIELLDAAGSVR